MKIGICLAANDYTHSATTYDLAKLAWYTAHERPDWELAFYQSRGTWLPQVRHDTVAQALNEECDWLFFIDSDMRFPPESLERMIGWGKTVVAANYTQRRHPFLPVSVNLQGERVYTSATSDGLESIASTGMGLMLVRSDLPKKAGPPWFMLGWHQDRQYITGEDTYFCRKLRDAGAEIWLDHGLSHDVTHLGIIEFQQSHALKMPHAIPAETEV